MAQVSTEPPVKYEMHFEPMAIEHLGLRLN
jgi:hypothetical protein